MSIENTFRKQLHQATKAEHVAVEDLFSFNQGINATNLALFYNTMLSARLACKTILDHLDITTYNDVLISALQKDLNTIEGVNHSAEKQHLIKLNVPETFSYQLGVFYVFAGSSAGAKILLGMAKKQNIQFPFYYLKALVDSSKAQMATLKQLLEKAQFHKDEVITSAKNTFKLIQDIGIYEREQKHTKLQNT